MLILLLRSGPWSWVAYLRLAYGTCS